MPWALSARLIGAVAGKSSYYIGLANGLMPCGPLQAMQLYALSSGNWWRGALSMFCFCLGTIPLMLGEDGYAVVQGDTQYVYSELEFGGYPVITV